MSLHIIEEYLIWNELVSLSATARFLKDEHWHFKTGSEAEAGLMIIVAEQLISAATLLYSSSLSCSRVFNYRKLTMMMHKEQSVYLKCLFLYSKTHWLKSADYTGL